ncbi:hypothetical protein T12_5711 [Trichinella patagoniensis]|uniref:Uncharacterized protein n=1 Tax=Trichinella patagoniensis TaxID=990121 RepID=A0A0V1A6M1_9BILA|nr:hypothetical protein T12_5711 [Trichinella patagoniensis]
MLQNRLDAEMLKVWSVDVTETVCKIETVNLQLLFNLNEAEVKRATLTGWSFMLCNQILPSIGNAFSCIGEALFTCKPI